MKEGNIKFFYFEKGDYVRTILGVGIVLEDELYIRNEQEFIDSEILVQHKYDCQENINNSPKYMERKESWRITEDEYINDIKMII